MPDQLTLATQADNSFKAKRKPTRRNIFLAEMDKDVPWAQLYALIEPYYPKLRVDGGGWPAVGLERVLRIHFLQQWYEQLDSAVEEALYDLAAMRRFGGIDPGRELAPDETAAYKFRHLLGARLGGATVQSGERAPAQAGAEALPGYDRGCHNLGRPSSTKNRDKARDPQMHQKRKGSQWYFGRKANIGVDERTGLVHSVVTTAANEADVTQEGKLLHGKETAVFADAGYTGVDKRIPGKRGRRWWIASRRSTIKAIIDEKLRDHG